MVKEHELIGEGVIKKVFKGFKSRQTSSWKQEMTITILRYSAPAEDSLTYDHFSHFYKALVAFHRRCGNNCIHLKRFLNRIGFTTHYWAKRSLLPLPKSHPNPFQSTLPNIQ